MLVVGVEFTGAIARGRGQEEGRRGRTEEEICEERKTRLSRARPTSDVHDFEESKMAGGGEKGIKKKELGKDFKLVYNDVEMRTIID